MLNSISQNIYPYFIRALPSFVALLLVLITFIPYRIDYISEYVPMIDVIIVYYWCMYNPRAIPQWFIFAFALLHDSLYGTFITSDFEMPLGISAFLLLILRFGVLSQRHLFLKESFFIIWSGFAIFALGITIMKWLIFMLYSADFYYSIDIFTKWITSIFLYPILHTVFHKINFITDEADGNA